MERECGDVDGLVFNIWQTPIFIDKPRDIKDTHWIFETDFHVTSYKVIQRDTRLLQCYMLDLKPKYPFLLFLERDRSMLNTNWSVLDWNEMARLRQPLGMFSSVFQMHFINPNFLKSIQPLLNCNQRNLKRFNNWESIWEAWWNIEKMLQYLVKNYLYSSNVEVSMDLVEPLSLILGS